MALHSVDGPDAFGADEGVDVDADAGFFDMSPAGAEQVTLQIRSMMERAWEYIAIAYQGRAHIALGYETWDEYVDDRLSDLRLTVPRQERGAVVRSLSRAQMSLRAIAKVLGVDVATVHRALGGTDPAGRAERDGADEAAPIRGRDGKQYPRRRRPTATPCAICGEVHDGDPDECPWDLFAQGLGPRPERRDGRSGASVDDRQRGEMVEVKADRPDDTGADSSPQSTTADEVQAATILDSVTRAVCLVDELAMLPELVDEIEVSDVAAGPAELAAGIRELVEHLRVQAAAIGSLADRLERIAPTR
ncbi:helix-turn-helix domain-containing protein [Nakamurella sp.]|uniref:helix-turn-helix domain-containing protein n=1 Tax=Nakamurella sp. TaxID=1869182 RepID=UPI003B3AFFF2